MASASNAAASSTNFRSNGTLGRRTSRNMNSRLPDWCGCGARPVLRWSGTNTNLGRPFFGFPNYNTVGKRWCGLFLWVDKIQEEDVTTINGREIPTIDNEEWKMKIAWKLGTLESEVRVLKLGGAMLFVCILLVIVVLFFKWDNQFGQLYLVENK